MACRVISRITDSVKCSTLSLRKCFDCVEVISAIKVQPKTTSLPESPTPEVASRRPALGRQPSDPRLARSWGRESPRADFLRPPESSRCGRDRGQFLRVEACHIPALPERIRSVPALLPRSFPVRGKFCSARPDGEYEYSPNRAPCRSTRRHKPAPAPRSTPTADRATTPRPPPAWACPLHAAK